MMNPGQQHHNDDLPAAEPRDAAAHWFARNQSGDMTPAEHEAFETWKKSSCHHEEEYEALEHIWDAATRIPATRLSALAAQDSTAASGQDRKRGRWHSTRVAFAGVLLSLGGFAAYQWYSVQPVFDMHIATSHGERRKVSLPDGSVMHANVRTRAQISFYRDRRTVTLDTGEASFHVAPRSGQPFTVDAGHGQVRVAGTEFDVRREEKEVSVAVVSGIVEVAGSGGFDTPGALIARLTAGMGTSIDAQGTIGMPHAMNTAEVTAWREGKLVFDNRSLAEVVKEVSRYRPQPVRIAADSSDIAQLRLSSIFGIDDTDALLDALPNILPVKVRRHPDGLTEIYGR